MGNAQEKSKKKICQVAEEEQNENPKPLMGDSICEICMEEIPPENKFYNGSCDNIKNKKKKTKQKVCLSQHHFCTNCMAKYIQVNVTEYNRSKIECPHVRCNIAFDVISCRSIISPQLFVRWCDLLCESVIRTKLAHSKVCYCPECHEMILNECGGTAKRKPCPKCKTMLCFHCKDKASLCRSHKRRVGDLLRDRNDIVFMETVKQNNWSRCPNCKFYVEHAGDGCGIILCRCQRRFCYKCRKDVTRILRCRCGAVNMDYLIDQGYSASGRIETSCFGMKMSLVKIGL